MYYFVNFFDWKFYVPGAEMFFLYVFPAIYSDSEEMLGF